MCSQAKSTLFSNAKRIFAADRSANSNSISNLLNMNAHYFQIFYSLYAKYFMYMLQMLCWFFKCIWCLNRECCLSDKTKEIQCCYADLSDTGITIVWSQPYFFQDYTKQNYRNYQFCVHSNVQMFLGVIHKWWT